LINKASVNPLIDKIRGIGIDFDRIKYVYIVEGYLLNTEPLRVGKGAGELGEVDLPVIKLPDGKPYIPGSSLKGVLRSTAEVIARSEGLEVCEPSSSVTSFNMCSLAAELLTKIYYVLISGKSLDGKWFDSVMKNIERKYRGKVGEDVFNGIRKTYEDEGVEGIVDKYTPCIVCQLFGNTSLASHVEVMDSIPETNTYVLSRTRVSIDRFRGAARGRALFTYEYVPRGIKWKFRLVIKNVDLLSNDVKSKILRSVLSLLTSDEGFITVGGMKSVGLGHVKLLSDEVKVTKYVIKDFRLVKECELKLKEVIKS